MKKPKPGKLLSRVSALLRTPRRADHRSVDAPALVVGVAPAVVVVDKAEATARELAARLGELGEAKKGLDKSAGQTKEQVDAFFSELARHKHELAEGVRAVRKGACQPVADVASMCRALQRVVRSAARSKEEAGEHVGLLLSVGGAAAERRAASLGLVVPGGGTVRSALGAWKEACRLCVLVDGEWEAHPGVQPQPLASLSTARYYHSAAVVSPSNRVFVVGGRGSRSDLDSVERLRDDASAWEDVAPTIRFARELCGVCAVETAVIVVGGRSGSGVLDAVEAVDTLGGLHTMLPPFRGRVEGCGVVSVQGKVIVTGGRPNLDAVWMLDVGADEADPEQQQQHQPPFLLRWTPLPSMAQGRAFHGAAAEGGRVFVCGGASDESLASCEMLRVVGRDEDQRAWEELPPMPESLSFVGCCYGGGNVFVVGGDEAQRSVLALHVRKRRWTQVAELGTGRRGCAAVCVGKRVLVLGGYNLRKGGYLDSCEALEF